MKNKILFVALAFFLVSFSSALEVSLDVPESFSVGQEVYFNYSISSDILEPVEFLPSVFCPMAPMSLLEIREVVVAPGNSIEGKYIYLSNIDSSIPNQECVARLYVNGTKELTEVPFAISSGKEFDFNVLVCEDENCLVENNIFIYGDTVFIDFSSDLEGVEVRGMIEYPDKRAIAIVLPFSFIPDEAGGYKVELVAHKDGYKDSVEEIVVGVLEKKVDIPYTSIKNSGIKNMEENKEKRNISFYISFLLVTLLIGVSFYLRKFIFSKNEKFKKKKNN